MGGIDDPENLIELTVEEHAEAHRKLWEDHGNTYDEIAWRTLSGQISKEEAWKRARYSPEWFVAASASWTDERKQKLIERQTGRKYTEETKAKMRKTWEDSGRRAASAERMRFNRANGNIKNAPDINAKSYKVTTPSGEQMIIKNLSKWSKEVGLNHGSVQNVANGKRTSIYGYRIEAA
jgi:hypothetical protein